MSHAANNSRDAETRRIGNDDTDTAELEPTSGRRPRTVRLSRNTELSLPALSVVALILSGLSVWLWFLHQRTDAIPTMQQELHGVSDDVKCIKDILIHKALGP